MNDLQKIRKKVSTMNVLVVDDENAIREQAIIFMKKFCHNVDSAVNGEDALNMINKNNNYDIVLTDIRMPKINGLELAEKISTMHKELFVAIMSGSCVLYDKVNSHCDLFLEKPINLHNMKAMFETVIRKKSL